MQNELVQEFNVVKKRFGSVSGGYEVFVCGCITNNRGYYIQCERHDPEYLTTGHLSEGGLGIVRHTLDSYHFICPFGADLKTQSYEEMNRHLHAQHIAQLTQEQAKLPVWRTDKA